MMTAQPAAGRTCCPQPAPGCTAPLFITGAHARTWQLITATGGRGPVTGVFGIALTTARLAAQRDGHAWLVDDHGAQAHLHPTVDGWHITGEAPWADLARRVLTGPPTPQGVLP